MAKALIQLASGIAVEIGGTPEEVAKILALCGGKNADSAVKNRREISERSTKTMSLPATGATSPDLSQIVNLIKSCDEAEAIEENILDKTNQLERILLPLYIIHESLKGAYGLTSGEISQITKELGIPVSQPNASTTLSGVASRYVVGDKVRRRGQAVRYKISRRGLQHLKSVLAEPQKK